MNFLNPAALFALIAAGIPILLHFLNLRRLRVLPFSSILFLQKLEKTQIRSLKLREILLLILRTLLIAFLVIAAARPVAEMKIPGMSTQASQSTIILLDNSFSMELIDNEGIRFQRAKDALRAILQNAQYGDEFALILMADLSNQRWQEFTQNLSPLLQAIPDIRTAKTTAPLYPALERAASLLPEAQNINRNLVILSDFQKTNFNALPDSVPFPAKDVNCFLLPVGGSALNIEQNISIDTAIVLTKIFELYKPVEIQVQLRNSSREPAENVIVSLYFNEQRVSQKAVSIPAGSKQLVTLAAPVKNRGTIHAKVVVEGDILDLDNTYYFGFHIPEQIKIALVGNESELFYLRLALAPDTASAAYMIETVAPSSLPSRNLTEYQMLYLVDIPEYSASVVTQLRQYVESGGNVVIFPGKQSNIDNYNATLLPAFGLRPIILRQYSKDNPAQLLSIDPVHPLFAGVFRGETSSRPPETPEIWQIALSGGEHNIIESNDGAFLTENRIANGKILYFAVPPTADWSTFPFTGLFVSLMNRIVNYLAATETQGYLFTVGEPAQLLLPRKAGSFGTVKLIGPNNIEIQARVSTLPESAVLHLPAFSEPGTWEIRTPENAILGIVSFNVPAAESQLEFFSREEIREKLAKYFPPEHIIFLESPQQMRQILLTGVVRSELWKLFLILAILCAIAETLIARTRKSEAEG